jgi:hypothetical protein
MPQQHRNHSSQRVANGAKSTSHPARTHADQLYRAATECVRQRERYARLVASGVDEAEQQSALRVACLCDEILLDSVRLYEKAGGTEASQSSEEWWHKANALWHACREYQRHHHNCDEKSKRLSARNPEALKELAMEYDLEASALLALRLALATYQKVCPDCDIEQRRQTFVA